MAAAKTKEKQLLMKAVGARLTIAINASGWSRAALAKRAGLRYEAIGRLERGNRLPELPSLRALAEVLGVPAGWLVFGEPPVVDVPLAPPECRDQRRVGAADSDSSPS